MISKGKLKKVQIMKNKVFYKVNELLTEIEETQSVAIEEVAQKIVKCFEKGGILQAFGSGHSYGSALELTHRAGGFIPTKNIKEPALGAYESVEGVGTTFMKKVDVRENDIVFVISNSGRNPLPIEIAIEAKKKGGTVVTVSSVESSKQLTCKHSGGKNLYQIGDYNLDNRCPMGDSAIELEGLDYKICGMSAIVTNALLEAIVCRAAEIMVEKGEIPPMYKSQNIDGGRAFNENLEKKYIDRLNRI